MSNTKFNLNFLDHVFINIEGSEQLKKVFEDYFVGLIKEEHKEDADYYIQHKKAMNYVNIIPNAEVIKGFSAPKYHVKHFDKYYIASTHKDEKKGHHSIIKHDNKFKVITFGQSDENIVMRVAREIVSRTLLKENYIPLHASSISDNNSNVTLFFGKSGKGKSTSIFSSVIFGNKKPMSGDVTFVKNVSNNIEAIGFPWKLTIGDNVFDKFDNNKLADYAIELKNNKKGFKPSDFIKATNTTWKWKGTVKDFINVDLDINSAPKLVQNNSNDLFQSIIKYGLEKIWDFGDFLDIGKKKPDYSKLQDLLIKQTNYSKLTGKIIDYYRGKNYE